MGGAVLTHPSGTAGPDAVLVHDVPTVAVAEDGDRVAICDEGGAEILTLVEPPAVLEWGGDDSNFLIIFYREQWENSPIFSGWVAHSDRKARSRGACCNANRRIQYAKFTRRDRLGS